MSNQFNIQHDFTQNPNIEGFVESIWFEISNDVCDMRNLILTPSSFGVKTKSESTKKDVFKMDRYKLRGSSGFKDPFSYHKNEIIQSVN